VIATTSTEKLTSNERCVARTTRVRTAHTIGMAVDGNS
jgi:hypothetical protein